MSDPWWDGLSPVHCAIQCGSHLHQVTWAEGKLSAPDHPDADRERALAALGADPFVCLDLLDAWRRHHDDLEVLVRASRGPGDLARPDDSGGGVGGVLYGGPMPRAYASRAGFAALPARTSSIRSVYGSQSIGFTSYAPHRGPRHRHHPFEPAEGDDLDQLLRLDGGLIDRLAATVIETWTQRIATGDERVEAALPALRAAIYGRLVTAVRSWTGSRVPIELAMIGLGDTPSVDRGDDRIELRLSTSWLRDVWSRGLTTIFGQLCLSAERVSETTWRLVTVPPGFGATGTMTITLD